MVVKSRPSYEMLIVYLIEAVMRRHLLARIRTDHTIGKSLWCIFS
jgi:hypothetical protein